MSAIRTSLRRSRRRLGEFLRGFDRTAVRVCSSSPILASLYYMGNGAFRREQRAVLAGRRSQLPSSTSASLARTYALRRSIHRLEKGLTARDGRLPFAVDYIEATVRNLQAHLLEAGPAIADTGEDPLTLWARTVLDEYFARSASVSNDAVIRARDLYQRIALPTEGKTGTAREWRWDAPAPTVSLPQLMELARTRRSTRYFQPKSVSRSIVDDAVRVGAFSPSACNRQPFEFRVYDDPSLIARIATIPMGSTEYAEQIPCLVVLTGALAAYHSERDRHVIYIDASLAAMAFQLALRAQAVDSCCINWPEIPAREKRMRSVLTLRDDESIIMLIAVGYADPSCQVPISEKKPLSELRSYNRP